MLLKKLLKLCQNNFSNLLVAVSTCNITISIEKSASFCFSYLKIHLPNISSSSKRGNAFSIDRSTATLAGNNTNDFWSVATAYQIKEQDSVKKCCFCFVTNTILVSHFSVMYLPNLSCKIRVIS